MLELEDKGCFKDSECRMSFLVSANQGCCGLIGHVQVNGNPHVTHKGYAPTRSG